MSELRARSHCRLSSNKFERRWYRGFRDWLNVKDTPMRRVIDAQLQNGTQAGAAALGRRCAQESRRTRRRGRRFDETTRRGGRADAIQPIRLWRTFFRPTSKRGRRVEWIARNSAADTGEAPKSWRRRCDSFVGDRRRRGLRGCSRSCRGC